MEQTIKMSIFILILILIFFFYRFFMILSWLKYNLFSILLSWFGSAYPADHKRIDFIKFFFSCVHSKNKMFKFSDIMLIYVAFLKRILYFINIRIIQTQKWCMVNSEATLESTKDTSFIGFTDIHSFWSLIFC